MNAAPRQFDAPFPGLRPFEIDEAPLFYGRGSHLGDMLQLLHEQHGLAVVGSSGCGKSSLVKAGLLPEIMKGMLGSRNATWKCIVARPGGDPYFNLAKELVGQLSTQDGTASDSESILFCEQTLRCGPLGLFDAIDDTLPPENLHVLVLIDQFEELFRFSRRDKSDNSGDDPSKKEDQTNDALAFVDMLLATANRRNPRVYVALTMRSDFLGECDAFRGLPEWVTRCQFLPPRLTREELQDAISRPPQHPQFAGYVEPDVVSELIAAMGDRQDQLPLIQHALLRMWKLAEQNRLSASLSDELQKTSGAVAITRDHLNSIGGVANALNQHADQLFESLPQVTGLANAHHIVRRLFCALCQSGGDGRRVRRLSTVAEVAAIAEVTSDEVKQIVANFTAQGVNFVYASQTDAGETNLDISHESLIRNWSRLNDWLDMEEQAYSHYESLVRSANEYNVGNGELLHGLGLQNALKWWHSESVPTSPAWTDRVVRDSYMIAERFLQLSEQKEHQVKEDARLKALAEAEAKDRELKLAQELAVARQAEAKAQSERATLEAGRAKTFWIMLWVAGFIAISSIGLFVWASVAERRASQAEFAADRNAELADTMLERSEHLLYVSLVRTAEQNFEFFMERDDRVMELLDAGRWDYRGFDHSELYGRIGSQGDSNVNCVSFSPDGTQILSGSDDHTVRVWDATGYTQTGIDMTHSGPVNCVRFSPDGKYIVSGSEDHTIKVWDAVTYTQIGTDMQHSGSVNSVSFSPDGRSIVSGSFDGTIKVWDAAAYTQIGIDMKHGYSVSSVSFSPDGKQIISGSNDDTIKVWDAATYTQIGTEMQHSGSVNSVSFSPDGKHIVSGATFNRPIDNGVKVWDAAEVSDVRTGMQHSDAVESVSFSPDGKRIVSGSDDHTIKVWDATTYGPPRTLTGHTDAVQSVSFSPDGRHIVSGSDDLTIKVWDSATWSEVRTLTGHSDSVSSVSFSPDGMQLVSGSSDKTIKVWDAATWSEVRSTLTGHSGFVLSVSFSPDGKQLVSGSDDHTIKVWDAATWSEVRTLTGHSGSVLSVSFSPDGKQLVSGSDDHTMKVWDAATGSEVRMLGGHSGSVNSVSFSPDGKQLVSGSGDKTIKVWDGSRRRAMLPIFAGSDPINTATVSRDETLIVSGNAKGLVQVWDALSGQAMTNLLGHQYSVQAVAISPVMKRIVEKDDEPELTSPERLHRSQQVASGSSDRTVRLWDLELRHRRVLTATETKLDFDHEQGVHRIAYSENGRWIAAGGSSGLVRIWDTATHDLLDSFDAHQGFVKSLEFTDRDAALVTSGWAAERGPTEFRTWRIRDGKRMDSSGSELMPALPGNWHSGMATRGNLVAAGRSDGVLFVSDLGSKTKPVLILAHPGRKEMNDQGVEVVKQSDILAVAFSPDGELLATAGADHSIQLWNPRTGERRAVLSEHTAAVNSLQFYRHKSRGICAPCDPDELRLVSSGSDGTVRVWLVDEILAHAPLPVPFKHLDELPEIAAENSPTTASVNAETGPVSEAEPEPSVSSSEPVIVKPSHDTTTQPSSQTSVVIFIGLLALFALFQTIASSRRNRDNASTHSGGDPN